MIHSHYPGSGLNYMFVASWQGMDFIEQYFPSYLSEKGFTSQNIIVWDASFLKTIQALLNLEVFNYVINLSGNINHSELRNGGISVIEIHLNSLIKFISNSLTVAIVA